MSVKVGTPYRRMARGPDSYDCWGLVLAERPDIAGLARYQAGDRKDIEHHVELELRSEQWARVWPPEPGDIVLMGHSDQLVHAGVCVDGGIKHTTPRTGAIVQRLEDLQRSPLYRQFEAYRWLG